MRRPLLSSLLYPIYHSKLHLQYQIAQLLCELNLLKMAASIAPECNEIKEYVLYSTFPFVPLDSRWTNMRTLENTTPASSSGIVRVSYLCTSSEQLWLNKYR